MKRSEINGAIAWAKELLQQEQHSPARNGLLGHGRMEGKTPPSWTRFAKSCSAGTSPTSAPDDFASVGAVLYTVRNGLHGRPAAWACPSAKSTSS